MTIRLVLLFFCFLHFGLAAHAQPGYYTNVSQMPMFPGGVDSFHLYVKRNLKYPSDAIQSGKEGTVYISLVIDTFGKPTEIKCIKSLSPSCDQAAIDLFNQMPLWSAGKNQLVKVPVLLNIPIEFKLDQYFNRFLSNGVLLYRDPKVLPSWFHKLPFDKWIRQQFKETGNEISCKLPVTFELNIKIDSSGKVMEVLYAKSIPSDFASIKEAFQWVVNTIKTQSTKNWKPAVVEGEKVNATYFATITLP